MAPPESHYPWELSKVFNVDAQCIRQQGRTGVSMSSDSEMVGCVRRRDWRTLALVSGSVLTLVLMAPTGVEAETLKQALTGAYKTNPKLDAERARLRAVDEEVPRALSGYRPNVSGSADVGVQNQTTKPPSATNGETHPKGYSLSATQPLFRGFRTINNVGVAEATVRAGRETLRAQEQTVLQEAVTAYMDVVRDQSLVRLRENNVAVLSKELKATQDRFAVGEVTRTDVAQAESRRATSVATLDLARANLKSSRATFERVVGRPPSNLVEPRVPESMIPKSVTEAIGLATQQNPAVIGALYREQAARLTVDLIWGELLPTLQLEANYSKRYEPSRTTDESETSSLVGRLNVPIYQGGEVHARVRQAKHTHVSRLQEVEQNRTEVTSTTIAAFSSLQAVRARLVSDGIAVSSSQIALNGVREEEKVGQRTLLDVLNAEQELLNAQVTLVTDQRDLIVGAYALLVAVGRMDSATLHLASDTYDPEAHYFEVRRNWWGLSITHKDGRHEKHDLWESHGRHQPMK
jgi:outer membrane protein